MKYLIYPGILLFIAASGTLALAHGPVDAVGAEEDAIARAHHRFSSHHYRSTSKEEVQYLPEWDLAPDGTRLDKDQVYYGIYEVQPADRPDRMLPVTPKPRIHGIQTARVVGKKGEDSEEISTDEHGRIWVQFFWDREPQ